eukprot:1151415-Pelagomonas_calceolata.AAC.1
MDDTLPDTFIPTSEYEGLLQLAYASFGLTSSVSTILGRNMSPKPALLGHPRGKCRLRGTLLRPKLQQQVCWKPAGNTASAFGLLQGPRTGTQKQGGLARPQQATSVLALNPGRLLGLSKSTLRPQAAMLVARKELLGSAKSPGANIFQQFCLWGRIRGSRLSFAGVRYSHSLSSALLSADFRALPKQPPPACSGWPPGHSGHILGSTCRLGGAAGGLWHTGVWHTFWLEASGPYEGVGVHCITAANVLAQRIRVTSMTHHATEH